MFLTKYTEKKKGGAELRKQHEMGGGEQVKRILKGEIYKEKGIFLVYAIHSDIKKHNHIK